MLGTSGIQKEAVRFKIKGPINGIPHHKWRSGIYETRNVREIAMLRRLPSTRCEEVLGEIEEEVELPEVSVPEVPLEEWPWRELVKMATEAGFYQVGMTKSEVIIGLMELRKPIGISVA